MLSNKEIVLVKKDLSSYQENVDSQPIAKEALFNRADLLTCGWLPLIPSKKLKKLMVRSFHLFNQRIVVYRFADGSLNALDAFCPHMGADLGNGEVKGHQLQCFFHQWTFETDGTCHKLKNKKLNPYPTQEKYGYIWIFPLPGLVAPFPVAQPPTLENCQVEGIHLFKVKLFAHHHVMMAGGIDLQHFKSVHNLDIAFQYDVSSLDFDQSFLWSLEGKLPSDTLLQRFGTYLTGGLFRYKALFSGGTITSLTYGNDLQFRGHRFPLPTTSILWAATPHFNNVSEVDIFLILKKEKGPIGFIKKKLKMIFALVLLFLLKDDDVKAFPHMRFNVTNPSEGDRSVLDLIKRLNSLNISPWSNQQKDQ
jgi:phenylpropionate dioxygenase-like ring-hydroxylating dioxygenase large terminal subunit